MAFDRQDRLYIADGPHSSVYVLSSKGEVLNSWVYPLSEPSGFSENVSLVLGPNGEIYIADPKNDKVNRYAFDGSYIASFGQKGPTQDQPNSPTSVTVDEDGFVYVTVRGPAGSDWTRPPRIQKYSPLGEFIAEHRLFDISRPDSYSAPFLNTEVSLTASGTILVGYIGPAYFVEFDRNLTPLRRYELEGSPGWGGRDLLSMSRPVLSHDNTIYVADRLLGQPKVLAMQIPPTSTLQEK
jgi:hypothetical protein